MKFFTRAWLEGRLTDDQYRHTVTLYRRHLTQISPKLNPHLLDYLQRANLHDGRVRKIMVDPANATLQVDLRCGDLQVGYYDLDIEYQGVQLEQSALDTLARVAQLGGEVLRDELDLGTAGIFIQRIIFATHEEVALSFRDMRFRKTAQTGRDFSSGPGKFTLIH